MILLDTHIWLNWLILGEEALPPGIRNAIATADRIGVSSISCFEVTMLAMRGRIELPCGTEEWLIKALVPSGIEALPVTCEIGHRAVLLPEHHKDPADRLIIATALHHGAKLASVDSMFDSYSELNPDNPLGRAMRARRFASGSVHGRQTHSLVYGREARAPRRRKAPVRARVGRRPPNGLSGLNESLLK